MQAHHREVDVLPFSTSAPPGVIILDTLKVTEIQGSMGTLLAKAKKEAQKRGADGVLLLDEVRHYEELKTSTPLFGEEGELEYKLEQYDYLKYCTFVYKKNINYLDQYVHEEKVWELDSTGNKQSLAASITYGLDGQPQSTAFILPGFQKTYLQCLRSYDLEHLLYEESRFWHTRYELNSPHRVYVRSNTDYLFQHMSKRVYPHYVGEGDAIDYLDLKEMQFGPGTQRLYLNVDETGRLLSKEITTDETVLFVEYLDYDARGRIKSKTFYVVEAGGSTPLYLREYSYYPDTYEQYLRVSGQSGLNISDP